jgi:hydroxymethylglutaryl-CoA lyase
VLVREEGLRDGLQIERLGVTVEQKLELLEALVDAGITRIVVGSFVSPKWTPQMADTDAVVERLEPRDGVTYLALALNDKGRERMRRWVPPLTMPELPETHLHLCPVFLKRNTNRTMEQQEEFWRAPIDPARDSGATSAAIGLSAGWGSNWSGTFPRDQRIEELRRQYDAWAEAGFVVTKIQLADPMGWNVPSVVADDLRAYKRTFPTVSHFHLHLHNTRGMALASAYAALTSLGADDTLELDTGIGGIGGCPYCGNGRAAGMIPTEDLVQMLEAVGIPTGVDLYALVEASHLASRIVQRPLDGRVSLAGPLPDLAHRYDPRLPVIETLREAQHFRLGPEVHEGRNRPWEGDPVLPTPSEEPAGGGLR